MGTSIDLTQIAVAVVTGIFAIVTPIALLWIQKHMKDEAARDIITLAVKNSLGAIQKAATSEIQQLKPQIPGVPDSLVPGVQYVLDNAGSSLKRVGVTPDLIAQKIEAQIGLANIATNIATTSSTEPTEVVPPLASVPDAPVGALVVKA